MTEATEPVPASQQYGASGPLESLSPEDKSMYDMLVGFTANSWRQHQAQIPPTVAKLGVVLWDSEAYATLLTLLYKVVVEVETRMSRHKDNKVLSLFLAKTSDLKRTAALEQDLAHFLGPTWADKVRHTTTPVLEEYLAHLEEVDNETPQILLVFAFRLYLANLAGGSRVRSMVASIMKPEEGKGLAYFEPAMLGNKKERRAQLKEDVWTICKQHMRPETLAKAAEESEMVQKWNLRLIISSPVTVKQYARYAGSIGRATLRSGEVRSALGVGHKANVLALV